MYLLMMEPAEDWNRSNAADLLPPPELWSIRSTDRLSVLRPGIPLMLFCEPLRRASRLPPVWVADRVYMASELSEAGGGPTLGVSANQLKIETDVREMPFVGHSREIDLITSAAPYRFRLRLLLTVYCC